TLTVSGVVSNCGNITLTNITVTNFIATLNTSRLILTAATLAPGATLNFSDNYVVPLDSCGPYTDTVTARGVDKCDGRVVTAQDTKNCAGTNAPRLTLVKNCPASPPVP